MSATAVTDRREWETTPDRIWVRVPYQHNGSTLLRVVGWARHTANGLWEIRIPPQARGDKTTVGRAASQADAKRRLAELTRGVK